MRTAQDAITTELNMSRYLQWATQTADLLAHKQTLRLGERAGGEVCITYARGFEPAWTSVGVYDEKNIEIYPVPAKPVEPNADFMDMAAWPWLDRLSALTGDGRYSKIVDGMSAAFRDYGFDPRSGLGYIGQEAFFNVRTLGAASHTQGGTPRFKPYDDVPARMWRDMPEKIARMYKAAFYGLITREKDFDYNRFCYYGFRDADKKPSMSFNSNHVGFAQTASWLVGWWVDHYRHTGDVESLGWARKMTAKYRAVRGEKTGLVPHWFGNKKGATDTQDAQTMCNAGDAHTAIAFLKAAAAARGDARSEPLANELHDLGLRLMRGLCKYGYSGEERLFPSWLLIEDGAVDKSTIVYAFRTQAEKDHWVKIDPRLSVAHVYGGDGLFAGGPWTYAANPALVPALAKALPITRDPELIAFAKKLASHAMEESARLHGALNDKQQWTFPASAACASLHVGLHTVTGEAAHLENAKRLIDRELGVIDAPQPDGRPEWWRMGYRTTLINAALDVHEAMSR
jgi:hypothetical protein